MGDPKDVSSLQTVTLEPALLGGAIRRRRLTGGARPALPAAPPVVEPPPVAELPVFGESPARAGDVRTAADGTVHFVPAMVIPTRSARKKTPAVFLAVEHDSDTWRLVVWIDLVRPQGVPEDARPLPLTGIAGSFVSAVPGAATSFTEVADLPVPDPAVLRRVALAARVDPARVADALRSDQTAAVTLSATAHHSFVVSVDATERNRRLSEAAQVAFKVPKVPPLGRTPSFEDAERHEERLQNRHRLIMNGLRSLSWLDADVRAQIGDDQAEAMRLIHELLERQTSGPSSPVPRQAQVDLGAVTAFLPTSNRPNRAVYYQWNTVSGTDLTAGIDPDSVWLDGAAGMWQASPLPNEYYILPHEYRLAFDAERALPAMSVLLQSQGADSAVWKVRVRFRLLPWLDPVAAQQLREEIAEAEGAAYPELVVGNVDGVTFDVSTWLAGLGGDTVAAQGGTLTVDPRGFELVLDCSMQFYALLVRLLAPAAGVSSGVEGRVVFNLRTSADEATPSARREVPVRIRLDRPDDGFLTVAQVDAGFPDPAAWPQGWTPPLYCRVGVPAGMRVDVGGVVAALAVLDPVTGIPVDSATATADPATFSIGEAAVPATAPRPDPPQQAPQVAAGEVLLRLAQTAAPPIDPRQVGLIAVDFTGVTVRLDPAAVLERVHELGTSTGLVIHVELRCYQLKHPEALPPELADLFAVEVECRRGTAPPVTVTLDRDRPESGVDIPFAFADLVAGLWSDQPQFEYRCRNQATRGTGEFSAWQPFSGKDLHVRPVG